MSHRKRKLPNRKMEKQSCCDGDLRKAETRNRKDR
jgi:hypothetical protein